MILGMFPFFAMARSRTKVSSLPTTSSNDLGRYRSTQGTSYPPLGGFAAVALFSLLLLSGLVVAAPDGGGSFSVVSMLTSLAVSELMEIECRCFRKELRRLAAGNDRCRSNENDQCVVFASLCRSPLFRAKTSQKMRSTESSDFTRTNTQQGCTARRAKATTSTRRSSPRCCHGERQATDSISSSGMAQRKVGTCGRYILFS